MNAPIVSGQMGTVNDGQPLVGMKPDMGGMPRKKKRKDNQIAAVAAFKKQMRSR